MTVFSKFTDTRALLDRLDSFTVPFNFDAVFSDETLNFVSSNEPDFGETVTVKLRVGNNCCHRAFLCVGGKEIEMERLVEGGAYFEFYQAELIADGILDYFFRIEFTERVYYYNKRGVLPENDPAYNFRLIPGYKTPDWAKGAVYYQIYTDRFCNGDITNDVANNEYAYMGKAAKTISDWDAPVSEEDVCNFYGGDIAGIIKKLDYLSGLGVEVLYLNPLFVSPSNHKYDIQDYENIDPHFGVIVNDGGEVLDFERFNNRYATKYMKRTIDPENLKASNMLFAELVAKAHERGIRIIIDGVFNHCGAFSKWLDKEGFYFRATGVPGAYRSEESPYNSYFRWFNHLWPNNDSYDCWWEHDNHPKLNYEDSEELFQYIMGIGEKWVSPPYNADGWRLDVAADLGMNPGTNHRFFREFHKRVKSARPDAIILAEHYGSAEPWLNGSEWDTIMNYDAFMEPLTWFLTGMEKHSDMFDRESLNNAIRFENAMRYYGARLPAQAAMTAMNELSNHDHSRFLTRTNMTPGRLATHGPQAAERGTDKRVFMSAVVVQMTWPGCPAVYYGDEAGLCGWTDPDDRRTYPWGFEDKELIELHRLMISLRKSSKALKTGSLEYLFNDSGFLSFGRWNDTEKFAVAVNNNDSSRKAILPVWKLGVLSGETMTRAICTGTRGFTDKKSCRVTDGMIYVELEAKTSAVFVL